MKATFLGQPFSSDDQLGGRLTDLLEDASAFHVVTAWTQLSGLIQLESALRKLRKRGGTASILLGVDGGIATKESLELALELFDPALVFHDTGERIFHPKLYVSELPTETVVTVGSSNLTGFGLYENYEANTLLRLDPTDAADRKFLAAIDEFRDALTAAKMPTQVLSSKLIDTLAKDETLVVTAAKRAQAEAARKAKAKTVAKEIFGTPVRGLPKRPRKARKPGKSAAGSGRSPGTTKPSTAPAQLRWWKKLSKSDAMQKPAGSHQRTGVVLNKAGHKIDQKIWFRDELFASVTWSGETGSTGKAKESAEIPFDVWVDGKSRGNYSLRADHATNRVQGRSNSPTYLYWSGMRQIVDRADYAGWWLELARLTDGAFRLRLLRDAPAGA
jgi:HKD family nuclease